MLKQIIIAILVVALASFVSFGIIKSKKPPEKQEAVENTLTVDALEVKQKDINLQVKVQGRVEAKKRTNIVAELSGRVNYVSNKFVTGGFVKKGETLLKIDDTDYRIQLESVRAGKIGAESALAQEETRARIAQQEWEWRERKALDGRAKDIALRKPQLKAAKANVHTAALKINSAQQQLSKIHIRAPYDAIVGAKQVELGQFVAPGTVLGNVFSVAAANIRLAVPEKKLKYLSLPNVYGKGGSTQASIYANDDAAKQWPAKIIRNEGVIDPQTHFLYVIAEVKDPYAIQSHNNQPLRMGAFVNASLQGKTINGLVELPTSVIHSGNRVWLIDQASRIQEKEVSIEYTEAESVYVTGLDDGAKISTTVLTSVLPGQKVVIASLETQLAANDIPASNDMKNNQTEH